jgi:flagellar basal body rod protein FlgF
VSQTSLNTGGSQLSGDSVSLSDAAVSLMSSANQYETQVAVAQTANEMEQSTLSLLA